MVDLGIDVKHHTIIQKFRKGSKKSMLHQVYDHNDTSGRNLTNLSLTYYRSGSELQNEVAKKEKFCDRLHASIIQVPEVLWKGRQGARGIFDTNFEEHRSYSLGFLTKY